MSESTVFRLVRTEFDERMTPRAQSSTSPTECKIRALSLWPGRALVPIIFIPGIMGSNLRNTKQGANAWVPPNGILEKLGELGGRLTQSPEARQKQLTANDCEVFEANKGVAIPKDFNALGPEEAKRRHWGEVHADSYLAILMALELHLNYPYRDAEGENPQPRESWLQALNPQKWQAKSPLTEAEFNTRMGQIYFPVYACGYNWLQSNEESAKRVVQRIEEIEQRIEGNPYYSYSGKVILVTHSMGGLVGRRAAQLAGDKILGVVHGVQPVTGAPAVYRRFKAGTETNGFPDIFGGGTAVVLGWDAADVTCVLGNSPGPLELLPTQHYEPGWLQITDGKKTIKLPESDPYKEIYQVSADEKWWGMVNPSLLDPAGNLKNEPKTKPMNYFIKQLGKAQDFHEQVQLTCHPNTYAHYGDDIKQQSIHKVTWRTSDDLSGIDETMLKEVKPKHAKLTGRTDIEIDGRRIRFHLDGKDGPGDGTVPTPSGKAVGQLEGIRDVFKLDGFDHQFSYNNEISQHTVLYAIAKMVQALQLKEDGTCERL